MINRMRMVLERERDRQVQKDGEWYDHDGY